MGRKTESIVEMIIKCTLIVVYFTILFVATRFLEFAGVFSRGMRCSERHDDTQTLNAKQLQKVLDHRGISYRYVIERSELMSLVNSSGNLLVVVNVGHPEDRTPVSRNTAPAAPSAPSPNVGLSGTKKDRIDVFSQSTPVMQALAA